MDDTFAAVADIYVVKTGTIYRNSPVPLKLAGKDVSGGVNTVVQDSGFFVNEIIGSTAPIGKLTEGTYAVIYDECQDGYFDDGIDFLMDPAFTVRTDVPGPPDDINRVKSSASQEVAHYAQVAALIKTLQLVYKGAEIFAKGEEIVDVVLNPEKLGEWFITSVSESEQFFPNPFGDVNELFAEVDKLLLNNIKHSVAIVADPPDADFKQLTPLSGRHIIDPQSSDPLLIAMANVGTASSTQGALAEALLHSLERYQGAEAAGAGGWALTHARAIKQYANLLAAHVSQMNDALAQLSNALANDTRPLDTIAAALESQRARVELLGFSVEERQIFASLGLTVVQMNALQAALATQSFVFTKAALMQAITDAQNSNAAYSTALSNLAAAMTTNITTLEQDPVVLNQAPRANAGGPYRVAEGATLVFNGSASTSPSTIIRYEWDLDGDGSFNDATGPNPSFTYTRAFQGLVGVKVTNADNLADVSYAPIEVTNVNNPPRITAFTPTDRSLDLIPGSSQSFSVTASDPEGDAVSVRWLVDGTPTATGPTFTYTPSLASGGLHIIEAVATDASPFGGADRLSWIVALPAPATSANLSIAMSGTSESGQGSIKLTYQMTVTNNGPAPATGVMLTDTLPTGLSFGSMTASQGSCTSLTPHTMTCALGNLASGASATAALVGTPTTTATITNTARVTAAEFDPDLGNNSTSQDMVVDFIWLRQSGIPVNSSTVTVATDTSGVYVTALESLGTSFWTFLIKYDTSGTEVWRQKFTDLGGQGVAADASGVYIIWFAIVGGNPDTITSKFDADGTELWTRQFGGVFDSPADIAVAAGGVYVVVHDHDRRGFVRKYDTNGIELWTRPLSLEGLSVAADTSGIYVLYNHFSGGRDLSKYDVNGNEVWTIHPPNCCGYSIQTNSQLAVDAGGLYLVSGPGSDGSPPFVRKYTKDGNELWTRQFVLYSSPSLAVASDGSTVYVGGMNPPNSSGHIPSVIRKYDVNGNELSAQVFEVANYGATLVMDIALGCAGVFAAGFAANNTADADIFVMKLSSPIIPCNPHAPTVSTTSPLVVVNEGQVGRNSGIYANAGANLPVSLSASVGALTQTGTQDGTWEWSLNATDGPAQSQVVTITADDGQGEMATALFELLVNNVAPTVTITGAPASSPAGTPISLNSTVTDRSAADSAAGFTYAWTVTRDGQALTSGSGASLSFTPTSAGTYLVTLRAADKDGGTGTATVTIQVTQTTQTNQTITWNNPADITYGTALSATQLNATVSVPGPDPAGALMFSPGAGTILNAGPGQSLAVTAAATTNYNQATKMATINISKASLNVTTPSTSRPYYSANPVFTTWGSITGIQVSDPITATWSTTATLTSGVGTYPITATVSDGGSGKLANYTVANLGGTLTVTAVTNGTVTYTGLLDYATASSSANTATVSSSASVAVTTGDITTAKVLFTATPDGGGATQSCTASVGRTSGTTGNAQTGSASCTWTGSVSSIGGQNYTVVATLGGNYKGASDQADVNVHLPNQTNFITGGGYLVLTSYATGIYAGDVGSKANFGTNVKYNKSGTNLQGSVNIIVRKGTTVYQFKSNALLQLNVTPTGTTPMGATFTSKANGQSWDASNPTAITSLGGNWTIQLQMHDVAEPGAGKDTLGITVWDGSGALVFSSYWDTTTTKEQVIGGGNLQVH